jgi:hypothetical protein
MPKKIIVATEAGLPTGIIKFLFEDTTEQTVDLNSLTDEMKFRLMVHGASQKIGDSYAGAKSESDPVAFAKTAVSETIDQIVKGLWRVTASGGPRVTDLATVFAKVNGFSIEEAVEFVGGLTDEDVKALRKKPKIAAGLATLAAERAVAKAAAAAKAAEGSAE